MKRALVLLSLCALIAFVVILKGRGDRIGTSPPAVVELHESAAPQHGGMQTQLPIQVPMLSQGPATPRPPLPVRRAARSVPIHGPATGVSTETTHIPGPSISLEPARD